MRLAGTSHDAFLEGIGNSESTDYAERVLSEPLKYARYTSFGILAICGIAGQGVPSAPIAYFILSNCQILAALGTSKFN